MMPMTMSNQMALKEQIHALIGEDLVSVNSLLTAQFRSPSNFVQDVAQHVSRFQGKQIRPVLTLLSARMFDGFVTGRRTAHRLAAVVEMIHTATLVHDDVIDDAELRRHVSTVHRRWNTETSVLFGDYLLSRAFHLAATTGDAEACRMIGQATDRTCEGELNQIAARLEQSTSERDYFRIIGGKTGQLFSISCQLGARAAGATDSQQRRLGRFGMRVGLAFQIADDVLDLTGNEEETGKDAANDLTNHRLTLPLLRALRAASSEEKNRLMDQFASAAAGEQTRLQEQPLVQQGLESAQATAQALVRRAIRSLDLLAFTPARELLKHIAEFAGQRTAH